MHLHNHAVSAGMRKKYPFLSLITPLGGVVRNVLRLHSQEMHVPRFNSVVAGLGNLTMAYPHIADNAGYDLQAVGLMGCGADETHELAIVRAVAEAAERYATCVFDKRDVEIGSFDEIGARGIPHEDIPRCSAEEYADPLCPARRIDPKAPLRWVSGYSIVDRRRRLVPLIMTHLYVRPWDSEYFWLPISTGVAAHTDVTQATVSAICEVIERDAIALIWLLKMPLRRIWFDTPAPNAVAEKFERLHTSGLHQMFFDGATDVGVPTIYGLQLKESHPTSAQFVNCSTSFDAWDSCAKLIRESAMGRSILEHELPVPDDFRNFAALEHGAIYMGRATQREAFDFLTDASEMVSISQLDRGMPTTPAEQLRYLVSRFKALGMDIVLVDMTTDELRDAGLRVIRAVIPGLVPMTSSFRARYLGHPRLLRMQAELAAREGGGTKRDINPFPQPFA